MAKRPALGKGLSALIPDAADALAAPRASLDVDIDLLEPNDYQPRGAMDDERLEELAHSIKCERRDSADHRRAALESRPLSDHRRRAALARRAARRPAQSAGRRQGRRRRRDRSAGSRWRSSRTSSARISIPSRRRTRISGSSTSSGCGRKTSPPRSARIDRRSPTRLRLLKLPDEVRAEVASGRLSMGHARAIVALAERRRSAPRRARRPRARPLGARDRSARQEDSPRRLRRERNHAGKDVHTRAAEEQLRLALGTRVEINAAARAASSIASPTRTSCSGSTNTDSRERRCRRRVGRSAFGATEDGARSGRRSDAAI